MVLPNLFSYLLQLIASELVSLALSSEFEYKHLLVQAKYPSISISLLLNEKYELYFENMPSYNPVFLCINLFVALPFSRLTSYKCFPLISHLCVRAISILILIYIYIIIFLIKLTKFVVLNFFFLFFFVIFFYVKWNLFNFPISIYIQY